MPTRDKTSGVKEVIFMASFNPFITRRISNFIYEFESMLDPDEDAYDFGVDAQKFDRLQPFSISFVANGVGEILYFTDAYVMNWVADLIYDVFDGEDIDLSVRNMFETP